MYNMSRSIQHLHTQYVCCFFFSPLNSDFSGATESDGKEIAQTLDTTFGIYNIIRTQILINSMQTKRSQSDNATSQAIIVIGSSSSSSGNDNGNGNGGNESKTQRNNMIQIPMNKIT